MLVREFVREKAFEKAIEILEPVDVVVSGGGVGGIACAVALADSGRKVAVVERRGALGWEVGRARRVFLDLERAAPSSKAAAEIHRRLVEHGAYKEGVIHAPIAEIVFDHMVVARGVEPLFHAWPVAAAPGGEATQGLVVGTKEGYGLIKAPVIVETDECGRLVDPALRAPLDQRPVRRSFVLSGVDAGVFMNGSNQRGLGRIAERAQVLIRPLDGSFVQVDVFMAQADYAERERAFPSVVRRTVDTLRAIDPAFATAGIVYIADDEWSGPAFALRHCAVNTEQAPWGALLTGVNGEFEPCVIGAGDFVADGGVVLAGPWLPGAIKASNTEEVEVLNRICLGEAAARFVESVL